MSHQTSISAIGWSFPLKVFVKCRKESLRVIKERRDSGKPAKLTRFVRISASSWKTLLHCCLNRKLALIWLKQKWFPSFLLFPLYKTSFLTMPQEKSLTQLFGSLFIPCIIWWAGQTVGHELVQLFVTSFLFLSFQEPCQRRYSCQALSTALQWLLDQSSRFLETFLMGEGLVPNLMIAKTEGRAQKSFHKICERPQAQSRAKRKEKIEFVSLKIIFLRISVTGPKTENQNPRCNFKIVISKMKKKKSKIQNCQQHNVLEIRIKNQTSQFIGMPSVAPPKKLPTLLNTCNFLTDFLRGLYTSIATKYGNQVIYVYPKI